MSFVDFQSVGKDYQDRPVVSDFTLAVHAGERLAILGHSGCGKTTVLRLLAGLIAPDRGTISIGGKLVSAEGRILKGPEMRGLGMVFQDLALWPHLSVKGNLEFGLRSLRIPRGTWRNGSPGHSRWCACTTGPMHGPRTFLAASNSG